MSDKLEEEIRNFAALFNEITGAHMGIHDPGYTISIPSGCKKYNLCQLCRKKSEGFAQQCLADDQRYLREMMKTGEITYFRCHLGMTSVILPIKEGDMVLGVVDFGMIRLTPDPETEFDRIFSHLEKTYPADFTPDMRETMRRAYDDTAVMTRETMNNYVKLVTYAARGLYIERLFLSGETQKDAGFRTFIEGFDPVTVPLDRFSVEEIAKKLNISYSHLARLAKERLGTSLKQYVLSAKLEEAKKQLGSRPVKEIAFSVGIDDTRYFYKLFRRHTGMSCAEFVKRKQ